MTIARPTRLPLHDFLVQIQCWQAEPTGEQRDNVASAFQRVIAAHDAEGAYLQAELPPLAPMSLGAGSLVGRHSPPRQVGVTGRKLLIPGPATNSATIWVSGPDAAIDQLCEAVELTLAAVWTSQETIAQRGLLEALDLAVRGIASIGSVDHVLQLIVDRVRELVRAQYAALGIISAFGRIEQFITSGIDAQTKVKIGAVPRGRGLLGLIIREDHPFLIDDITLDERRHGFPEHHPEMHSFLGVPVRSKGRTIGNLYLTDKIGARSFTEDDRRLVGMFALHAAIAMENARLHEEIGRLAIVDERQRISQDLHDSIIQSLYAISLSLEDLPEIITEDPPEGAARADRAIDSIHATIRDIRNFIMGLQPELLEDADLATGIATLAAEFRGNTLIDLELQLDPTLPDLSQESAAHVLSITREALSNIARHSSATRASLDLTAHGGTMRLVIGDNGQGFDVGQTRSPRQRGLINLRSRSEAIGGELSLNSEAGAGTRLELILPVATGATVASVPEPIEGDSNSR